MLTQEQIDIEVKIIRIKERFNEKIKDFNSKYPEEEQKRFSEKKLGAERIIDGGNDLYIKTIAELKGITELQMAQYIKGKANDFELFYIKTEIERNIEIAKLLAQ